MIRLNKIKFLSIFLILIYAFLIYSYAHLSLSLSFSTLSFLSVLSLIISIITLKINNVYNSSIIFLFLISVSLFIFGRFIAVTLSELFSTPNFINNSHELFQVTWMNSFTPTLNEQKLLFIIVNFFCLFLTLGFILNKKKYSKEVNIKNPKSFLFVALLLFWLIYPYKFYLIYQTIQLTLSLGYKGLYANALNESNLAIINLIFFTSFAIIITKSKYYKVYMIAFLFLGLFSGLTGSRGDLVSYFLTLVYIYYHKNNKKINAFKIILLLLLIYMTMMGIYSLSSRAEGQSIGKTDPLLQFIFDQGITLSVIGFSLFSNIDYPIHTLLQSFMPLVFKVYSYIEPDVKFYTSSITTFTSYNANPKMFLSGAGLGSSIISEIFIFSFRNIVLFSVIIFFFGKILYFLEAKSKNNEFYHIFLIAILPLLLFSPRNGLNVLFVSSIYIILLIFMLNILSFLISKLNNK
ncbi:O-antigen polysaccharide polymerase Wzy [Providencia rettgeri]|uniref:O-antigen polysaccharide polymerase Wzy family protein n=1 Tax=Providencia rettgeri TaxID=587 RepID=A0AAW6UII7_PRORE|nr:O-antigen polysaccharide polymerase Wzy [Providencia rettgeri]ELR5060101.1 O-antigen polysaccharide polymerase Wzy [Providencia rettgeri]ELR5235889.1 O-antigen polysaccharide polymerase Wzy [Providencia rettgeri]ELU1337256.1 O-antigen polysaccharide polymerase Wzy [Providencia rettgeri]EMC2742562.1 O-antigen polysaccharide polymerase Wzy [Providencia rettgeri]EMD6655765.1 O-antigen polysaccharide polymerase Wzy [Providencia rettgeri]